MSEAGDFRSSTTRAEALARLAETLRRSGIEDPGREARLTLEAACGFAPLGMIVAPEEPLGPAAHRLATFAARRAAGEPLSRIVGKREFWGLALTIGAEVLDPRPETETVIEAAVRLFGHRRMDALRILDLGTGSGALLCALLSEFEGARGLGVDISPSAAKIALGNLEACGLTGRAEIRVGDWAMDSRRSLRPDRLEPALCPQRRHLQPAARGSRIRSPARARRRIRRACGLSSDRAGVRAPARRRRRSPGRNRRRTGGRRARNCGERGISGLRDFHGPIRSRARRGGAVAPDAFTALESTGGRSPWPRQRRRMNLAET